MITKYRPEIDGLRAIAIIMVFLYHLEIYFSSIKIFAGGFWGVDIFFVISGYLISLYLINELKTRKSIHILSYFERRLRRIVPLLFVVVSFTIILGWCLIPPVRYIDIVQSAFSAITFSSNFYFYFVEIAYESKNSLLLPLLHTWSLSVEGQFYLILPLIIYLLAGKKYEKLSLIIFSCILLLSLLLAIFFNSEDPIGNFYSPFSRLWEVLIGVFLGYVEPSRLRNKKLLSIFLPKISIFILIIYVLKTEETTHNPSLITLLPVLSVASIIYFTHEQELIGKILSSPFFVYVGRISYGLYLWHFPIFAFFRMHSDFTYYEQLTALFITFVVSAITYILVEKPFRNRTFISSKKFTLIITSFFIVLSFLIYLIFTTNGANFHKLPKTLKKVPKTSEQSYIAVMGDSHAGHLNYGLTILTNGYAKLFDSSGCIPFRDVDRYDYRFNPGACAVHTNKTLDHIINSEHIKIVILSTMGPVYLDNTAFQNQGMARVKGQEVRDISNSNEKDRYKIFKVGFERTISELKKAGKEIIYVIDVPEIGASYDKCLSANTGTRWRPLGPFIRTNLIDTNACRIAKEDYLKRTKKFRLLINRLQRTHPEVKFIDPEPLFCDDLYCYGYNENSLLYRDMDHLSEYGSLTLARYIINEANIEIVEFEK